MSAQNSLIKPSFTKSVMGYNTGEVDKYVEHVSERYNSVCRENAELKRRLLSESVRINEAEERIAELEKIAVTGKVLDKSALNKIFDSLSAEKERFAYFIESLKESLNDICADGEDLLTADDSWEETLCGYIEEVRDVSDTAEDASAEAVSDSDEADDTAGFYEICDDDSDAYDAETDNVLAIFDDSEDSGDMADEPFFIPDLDDDAFSADEPTEAPADNDDENEVAADSEGIIEEDVCVADESSDPEDLEEEAEEEKPVDTRTPAQIAADLDFYTDGDHADGESYDPMTLAAQITSRSSRPKFEDFMKPLPSDDN